MSARKGLLLAAMQPHPANEEEFNDWYDTEHVPERLATEGFLSAQRYVSIEGFPRYLALYELASVEVLHRPAYRAYSGDRLGPWSRRVLARVVGQYRAEASLVHPEDARPLPQAERGLLWLVRFSGVGEGGGDGIVAGLRERFEGRPEVRRLRVYRGTDVPDCFAIVELAAPPIERGLDPAGFGAAAGHITLANLYAAYTRRGH